MAGAAETAHCIKLIAAVVREAAPSGGGGGGGGSGATHTLRTIVAPTLVPRHSDWARTGGALNRIAVVGAQTGETVYAGAGAGGLPTANSVLSGKRLASSAPVPP